MPSRKSQIFMEVLKKNRPLFDRIGDRLMNAAKDDITLAQLPMLSTRGRTFFVGKTPCVFITPAGQPKKDCVIIHCHGGAYTSGGLLQARAIASKICAVSGVPTIAFAYRLAPEHPYPAALLDALAVYGYVSGQGYDMRRVILTGESAGGNLCLALTLKLKEMGLPLPGALLLLSPWTDLKQTSESYQTLVEEDVTLNKDDIMASALAYAGSEEALDNPMISPIYADFHGFPPVQIHVGTRELLLSDSELLCACLKRDNVPFTLLRFEGMCHVFQAFDFVESRVSLKAMAKYIAAILEGNAVVS